MDFETFTDFLSVLEDDGELVRVPVEVDAALELAEISRRVRHAPGGGPAVLFENVNGRSMPAATNVLGTERRMCRALRANSFDEIAARIAGLLKPDVPDGIFEALRLLPQYSRLINMPPRSVRTGVCQQVVKMGRDLDLGELPVPTAWPGETAPLITLGQVFTTDPETGVRSVGLYPLQISSRDSLLVHWHAHQAGWRHHQAFSRLKRQMPLAVALGGDPALWYAAAAPLPAYTDPCFLAGFLSNRNIDLVKARSIPVEVPANAEIVLEGYIDTAAELESSGPLSLPTGFYGESRRVPRMQLSALTHRANPAFPAMIYGPPPAEDFWLQKASERIFLPLVKLAIPELVDLHLPEAGMFRNLLFVSIRKVYPQQARKVMHALWSLDRLMVSKFIVVVDHDVDVHDDAQVWFHVGAHAHPGRDAVFCEGPGDMLDHAAPIRGLGHKLGIDATRKLPDEGHPRPWPDPLKTTAEISELVDRRWQEYRIDGLPPQGAAS